MSAPGCSFGLRSCTGPRPDEYFPRHFVDVLEKLTWLRTQYRFGLVPRPDAGPGTPLGLFGSDDMPLCAGGGRTSRGRSWVAEASGTVPGLTRLGSGAFSQAATHVESARIPAARSFFIVDTR